MQNNETLLLIMSVTLFVILLLTAVFGIIAYKMYLRQQRNTINDMKASHEKTLAELMDNYDALMKNNADVMIKLIEKENK